MLLADQGIHDWSQNQDFASSTQYTTEENNNSFDNEIPGYELHSSQSPQPTTTPPPPYDSDIESPSYLEKLHKRSDLISFDPRYNIPILRINARLVSNSQKLNIALLKLSQLNIIPKNIDLWSIIYFEDSQFFKFKPQLIENYHDPEFIRDLWLIDRMEQRERVSDEITRAAAISLEEDSRKKMLRGFRFRFGREVVPVVRS
ncbi:uncharacterized protein J8A68_005757 [[Candida] subhashii]|uniref:Uncharacterized protein n=1 Tax=[Candida] subhashii TaxID=561895 RepID=A0A8J5QFT5_9ASCO|nr:uncharacterized protein J8A68_005757 [[Candida] subhashii]KAG7660795.1 hypothetical protein J8A68_005757 [[Candida] subhashii]